MKVIIAGSRHCTDRKLLDEAIRESGFKITGVVSGGARGVDTMGEDWAAEHGVSIHLYAAEWDKYGRAAGPIRNQQMAKDSGAEALIALKSSEARGTASMIKEAKKAGLKIFVKEIPE